MSVDKDLDSEYPGYLYLGKMASKKEKIMEISSFEQLDGLDVASGNRFSRTDSRFATLNHKNGGSHTKP